MSLIDAQRFRHEMFGWLLRTLACAAPSAFWVLCAEPMGSGELWGIATGVFLYALAFATGCSLRAARSSPARRGAVDALRLAAWLKAGWGMLGFGAYMDFFTGARCFEQVGGSVRLHLTTSPYFVTLLITLAQGTTIALELFVLAAIVLGAREPRRRREERRLAAV